MLSNRWRRECLVWNSRMGLISLSLLMHAFHFHFIRVIRHMLHTYEDCTTGTCSLVLASTSAKRAYKRNLLLPSNLSSCTNFLSSEQLGRLRRRALMLHHGSRATSCLAHLRYFHCRRLGLPGTGQNIQISSPFSFSPIYIHSSN